MVIETGEQPLAASGQIPQNQVAIELILIDGIVMVGVHPLEILMEQGSRWDFMQIEQKIRVLIQLLKPGVARIRVWCIAFSNQQTAGNDKFFHCYWH